MAESCFTGDNDSLVNSRDVLLLWVSVSTNLSLLPSILQTGWNRRDQSAFEA